MEDFLSNKDSSDGFIGQSPVRKMVNFAIKTCRHRLYTGYKGCRIIGVVPDPEFVTNGEYANSPFTGESAQLAIVKSPILRLIV